LATNRHSSSSSGGGSGTGAGSGNWPFFRFNLTLPLATKDVTIDFGDAPLHEDDVDAMVELTINGLQPPCRLFTTNVSSLSSSSSSSLSSKSNVMKFLGASGPLTEWGSDLPTVRTGHCIAQLDSWDGEPTVGVASAVASVDSIAVNVSSSLGSGGNSSNSFSSSSTSLDASDFSENDASLDVEVSLDGGPDQAVDGDFYSSWQTAHPFATGAEASLSFSFERNKLTVLSEIRLFWGGAFQNAPCDYVIEGRNATAKLPMEASEGWREVAHFTNAAPPSGLPTGAPSASPTPFSSPQPTTFEPCVGDLSISAHASGHVVDDGSGGSNTASLLVAWFDASATPSPSVAVTRTSEPTALPTLSSPPTQAPSASYRFLGCYADDAERVFDVIAGDFHDDNTAAFCAEQCRDRDDGGYPFFSTQYGSQCNCGHQYDGLGASSACTMPCAGDESEVCGGSWANSVYEFLVHPGDGDNSDNNDNGDGFPPTPAPSLSPPPTNVLDRSYDASDWLARGTFNEKKLATCPSWSYLRSSIALLSLSLDF
jgi:hypothetical protein